MSETAAGTEPNLMSNVRLCDAIKWHPCLYDSKSKVYQMKHAVDAAWQSIANECEDTVANCKLRWRIIRKSFLRSFRQNVPNNRYYLTDYLDFLRPHLRTLCANEEMASNAEDFDMVQLEDVAGNSQDDDAEGEEEEYEDEEDPDEDEHEKQDGDNDDEDAEVEEYELDEENGEKDDEDSDTASAEETLKLNRGGRRKGKGSNMTTPDVDEAADDTYQPTGTVNKLEDTARTERRLVRTRKANIRYKEYDTYDKKRHQEQKPDDKRRAGKRSLEPEISIKQEPKQEEKRLRRSLERQREVNAAALNMYKKAKVLPKKVEVKLAKTKIIEAPPAPPPPPVEITVPKVDVKEKEREVYKVRTSFVKVDKKLTEQALAAKPKMTDNYTEISAPKTKDRGTQCGVNEPTTLDDAFIESLKPQIAIMNSRQKFNFKRRVYQALMDVFDDAANFPNKNELIELPPMGAPRFDNTTSGELRLMRELVNLVTAAKSTPEIMLAKDKVATPDDDDDDEVIETTPVSPADKQSSPATASVHQAKRHETLGLPRHILQKVVKVAGCNGGTILAHEGDKRRVYRIYPKGTVPPSVANNASGASSQASIGTFYVTPPRTHNAGNTSASQPSKIITSGGNAANGKQPTVTSVILRRGDNQVVSNNSTATATTASPVIKSSSAQREITVSRQRVAVRSQFPMARRGSLTNSSAKNSPVQNKVVTSTNIPATAATQEKPSPSNAYPVQRFSAASLEGANKKGLSQIQISQPVSLNAAAKREHNIRTFLSSNQGPEPYEDSSGDNEIFPDNPKPETREDDSGQSITDMVDNNYGAANQDIKSEPID